MEEVGKFKYHIKDIVYGANDGIISTFAIVSGVLGAGLSVSIILIIGAASLFADGFSMAASNYLGSRSEEAVYKNDGEVGSLHIHPVTSGVYTFISFVIAGSVPLLAFIFSIGEDSFTFSLVATFIALFVIGSARTYVTHRSFIHAGIEMVLVGGVAALIAFFIGQFISSLVS